MTLYKEVFMRNLIVSLISIIVGILIIIVNCYHISHVAPLMQETQLFQGFILAAIFIMSGIIILTQKK